MNDEGYSDLSKSMSNLIIKANGHLERLRSGEAAIKNQDRWFDQWRLHQERQIAREKMAQQAMQTHVIWHI